MSSLPTLYLNLSVDCQACIEPVLCSWIVMYSVIGYNINLK